MADQDALTDDEFESLAAIHENAGKPLCDAVEAIVAARVAQVTADRDIWMGQVVGVRKQQIAAIREAEAAGRAQRTAEAERDALVEKVRALADEYAQTGSPNLIARDLIVSDLRAVLPPTGDHT